MRRLNLLLPVAAEVAVTEVIGEDEDDVGRGGRSRRGERDQREHEEQSHGRTNGSAGICVASTSASFTFSTSTVCFPPAKAMKRLPVVLDDVRVVDVPAADEVEHLGEDEAVGADRERQRIALLRIRIRDEDVASVAQAQAADLRGGVGEVRLHRRAPGAAVVGGEGAVEKTAAAIVAEDGGEILIGQNPPVGLLRLQFRSWCRARETTPTDRAPSRRRRGNARRVFA